MNKTVWVVRAKENRHRPKITHQHSIYTIFSSKDTAEAYATSVLDEVVEATLSVNE